jgi:hypothetical protein
MKYVKWIFIWSLSVTLMSCHTQKMKIKRTSEEFVSDKISSGSGIVKFRNAYYAIGDDSPFLFELNNEFKVNKKIALRDSSLVVNNRIEKPKKPDFEALDMINDSELVVFGSGSKSPQRDVFMRVLFGAAVEIEQYTVTDFYTQLKALDVFSDSELNLEAVAFRKGQLYLFNRRKNLVLQFDYDALLKHLKGESSFPKPNITQFELPKINDIESGFSGASALKKEGKILFTSSVENTNDAYNDGAILGSFIGMIDITENGLSKTIQYCRIPDTKDKLKIESVAIDEEVAVGKVKVVLIADNDDGTSVIVRGVVSW